MTSPFPPYLAEANPLAGLTRCIRQICMLREQGSVAEAQQVEQNEFTNTLRDLRLAHGPEILPESELRTMFAAEQKRAADAVVLSELLIPQLLKSFGNSVPAMAQSSRPATTAASSRDSSVSVPKAAAAPGVTPMITDLLDAMLASERGGRRSVSSSAGS